MWTKYRDISENWFLGWKNLSIKFKSLSCDPRAPQASVSAPGWKLLRSYLTECLLLHRSFLSLSLFHSDCCPWTCYFSSWHLKANFRQLVSTLWGLVITACRVTASGRSNCSCTVRTNYTNSEDKQAVTQPWTCSFLVYKCKQIKGDYDEPVVKVTSTPLKQFMHRKQRKCRRLIHCSVWNCSTAA